MAELRAEIAVAADHAGVRAAADFAAAFADRHELGETVRGHLLLVVEELLTNLVKYGGGTGAELALALQAEGVAVEISDDGQPFDPFAAAVPDLDGGAEERVIGGLGLHLVRSIAASARHVREGGRNRMVLLLRRTA